MLHFYLLIFKRILKKYQNRKRKIKKNNSNEFIKSSHRNRKISRREKNDESFISKYLIRHGLSFFKELLFVLIHFITYPATKSCQFVELLIVKYISPFESHNMILQGKVCLVTGGTKGIGKGIALQLSQAGATVYITGRTLKRNPDGLGSSLEEAAEEIESRGGKCVPIQCDHSKDDEIKQLFEKIKQNENGRLDVLVNNAYGAIGSISPSESVKFYDLEPSLWDDANNVGLRNHYICTVYAARIMVENRSGLIITISSFGGLQYLFNVPYGVGKEACDRMMVDCGIELKSKNVTCISLWPGPVITETIAVALTTANEHVKTVFDQAESPEFPGKCIARLAADPHIHKKTSRILMTCDLGDEYDLKDTDGQKIASVRSISRYLRVFGWKLTASLIPEFLKMPHWFLHCYGGYKF